MPAYNFSVFIDKVALGEKLCTIRRQRKRPTVVGDVLFLYKGMRTKECMRLRVVVCRKVSPIRIVYNRVLRVRLSGRWLKQDEICELARRDGFERLQDFVGFFCKVRLAFEGELIEWSKSGGAIDYV